MKDRKSAVIKGVGQNRAANTIRLRKRWGREKIERESMGEKMEDFQSWAEKNYPKVKILR